jgi:hypothetical protein
LRFLLHLTLNRKVQHLQNFFPKVTQDEYDPTNFILEDANGKKFILDDKSKTTFGDVIDEGKGITQAVTSTGGAIVGTVVRAWRNNSWFRCRSSCRFRDLMKE